MKTVNNFDVIVIGGGPGGSTLGALLAQQGFSIAIVEKTTFPRFTIGESLLPFSMDVLKESGAFPKVDQSGAFLRKYGAQFIDWQWEKEIYFDFVDGLDSDHGFAFEVQRDIFDKLLLDHARTEGVTVFEDQSVKDFEELEAGISVKTSSQNLSAKYLVDASGRSAVVSRKLKLRRRREEFNNIAIHGHFSGIKRSSGQRAGDIIIGILPNSSWSWVIPFQGDASSVGIVVDAKKHRDKKFDESFIRQALDCHPLFQDLTAEMRGESDIRVDSNYSEYSEAFFGDRWLLLGDAASFLDPVFSTGVHVSLQSASFANAVLKEALEGSSLLSNLPKAKEYKEKLDTGLGRFRSLLRIFYGPEFMGAMHKVMKRPHSRRAFTSIIGGDAWNESNELFRLGVL